MPYLAFMSRFTGGASEILHRFIFPPFTSVWSMLRNLAGRQRRTDKETKSVEKSNEKARRKKLWNRSHNR